MRAKVVSLPPSISPSAVAESFADLVTIDRIAVSTVTEPPGFTPSFVGASAEALAENTTGVFLLILPFAIASKVRYSVIILVSEAG